MSSQRTIFFLLRKDKLVNLKITVIFILPSNRAISQKMEGKSFKNNWVWQYFCPQLSRAKEDVTQNCVIVHEIITDCFSEGMTWDEWPHVKFFGSLIVLWELIDVSLLILLWMMRNFFADVRKGGDFLKSSEQNDIVNKIFFFSRTNRQRGKVQHLHVQTAYVTVIFKTPGLTRLSRVLSHTNHKSGKFQSFQVQTAWQYNSQ